MKVLDGGDAGCSAVEWYTSSSLSKAAARKTLDIAFRCDELMPFGCDTKSSNIYATGLSTQQTLGPGISGCAWGLCRKSVESRQLHSAPGEQNLFHRFNNVMRLRAPRRA